MTDFTSNSRLTSPPPTPHRGRDSAHLAPTEELPPPYSSYDSGSYASQDPRTSSTQSLVPPDDRDGRRKLLLVYIHGFMGDETSFQSFPAHVHNLLSITLAETHVIHTKIYPKYRSRHAIDVARDGFSRWLAPHEDSLTDVVLLGHSMGGLLSSEIVFVPADYSHNGQPFRHRIVGTINFDTPFLGMHPGVVVSGLSSLFRPADPPDAAKEQSADASSSVPLRADTLLRRPADPNYNPRFQNDVILPIRKGWDNRLHFVMKHSSNLLKASKQYVASHLEFGGVMADYPGLMRRYSLIRGLEEYDFGKRQAAVPSIQNPPRVRFVNYYTASTGRPKREKSPVKDGLNSEQSTQSALSPTSSIPVSATTSRMSADYSSNPSPKISIEEHRGDGIVPKEPESSLAPLREVSPRPSVSNDETPVDLPVDLPVDSPVDSPGVPDLPTVPPAPEEPPFLNPAEYPDKEARKKAEKEHSQALKDYKQAVKDRNAVLKQRIKILEKAEKDRAKQEKQRLKEGTRAVKQQSSNSNNPTPQQTETSSLSSSYFPHQSNPSMLSVASFSSTEDLNYSTPISQTSSSQSAQQHQQQPKKKRDRKFCTLPSRDRATGERDSTWVRVFMEGVDEVGAHCGLFFMSDTYEMLVGDVGARIEEWVRSGVGYKR